MEQVKQFIDIFLHLDKYLGVITQQYGILSYLIIFVLVFCETGLVVTPFLPGDSLLFAIGALSANGVFNIGIFYIVLCFAAVAGDTVNYHIGYMFRDKVEKKENIRFIKREYLEKTQAFFDKHGGKTIIIARFIPIIRTFAPFVSGVGKMPYLKFLAYNAIGGVSWVAIALFGGYFFGNLPVVKDNFSIAILGIVFVSLIPVIIAYLRNKMIPKEN
jgi:membrane-associated protein